MFCMQVLFLQSNNEMCGNFVILMVLIDAGYRSSAQNTSPLSHLLFQVNQQLQTLNVPQVDDVEFYLFSRGVSDKSWQPGIDDVDNKLQLKLIVHGWGENRARPYYKKMTDAYLLRGDYNVIHVDWSKPARTGYNNAVKNTMQVGKKVAKFVVDLSQENGISLRNFHIIGHSLGAHVAGVAGKEIRKLSNAKVGRITALDPAGPLYERMSNNDERRLTRDDAEMVDVIHTDGGGFGYRKPIGTVDFFPNGGVALQPGCSLLQSNKQNVLNNSFQYAFCSHMKSHEYFIRSITSKIMATRCNSWAEYEVQVCTFREKIVFGEDAPISATGKYYLKIQ